MLGRAFVRLSVFPKMIRPTFILLFLPPTKLDELFADNVKLTLRTQPNLPVRIVQR